MGKRFQAVSTLVILMAQGLLLHACGPSSTSSNAPIQIGDTDIIRRSCTPSAHAPAFRRLDSIKSDDALVGACGELAWTSADSNALHYLATDAEAREVSANAWVRWFEGDRILFGDPDGHTLVEDGSVIRTWPESDAETVGKLPGIDAFWACDREHGIFRLDPGGVTKLTPDFWAPEEQRWLSGCSNIDASPSGAIAYPTAQHRIGVVDAVTGSRRTIDHPFYPHGTNGDRSDLVRLSPDGKLVFHQEQKDEIAVFLPDAYEPLLIPGTLWESWRYGVFGQVWFSLWMGTTASGVFVPELRELGVLEDDGRLVGIGDPITLQGVSPRAVRGNHLFVETPRGAGLLDLGTGKLHRLLDAPSIAGVVPFRWGGPVAITHALDEHIQRSSSVYIQVWALSLWSDGIGASQIARASEPITVLAVGPDGSTIATGPFLSGLPTTGAPMEVETSVRLISPSGRVIRELDPGSWIMDGIGGEHFAILRRHRFDAGVKSEELVAVDWQTGDETILVAGKAVAFWSLDHSDLRLSATISPTEAGLPSEVWSGVVRR
jgi:hypothetical protein